MNTIGRRAGERAFGLVEMLAIVAVVIVLGIVFMPQMAGCGTKAPRIKCVNNLKNVGLAFRIFATDNSDQFPSAIMVSNGVDLGSIKVVDVYGWLSNELSTPKIVFCPADKKREAAESFTNFTRENISYFATLSADETNPRTFLAGDRNLQVGGKPARAGLHIVTTNAVLGWTKELHNEQGNIAMGDGSVQQFSIARLQQAAREQEVETNYLVIP